MADRADPNAKTIIYVGIVGTVVVFLIVILLQIVFYQTQEAFKPSFIVDISDVYPRKMEAIRAYESQFHKAGSTEPETFISRKAFLEFIEARDRMYGFQIDSAYGEPFYVKEPLRVTDPLSLLAREA